MHRFYRVSGLLLVLVLAACSPDVPPSPTPTLTPEATVALTSTPEPNTPTPTETAAPVVDRGICPPAITAAFSNTQIICDTTQRNQVCYSNNLVTYAPREGRSPAFDSPGDIAPVADFERLELSSDETTGQFGIMLMRVQADLPESMPGENVTMLLFGGGSFSQTGTNAFVFSSGIGQLRCNGAPADGLLIQSPQGAYEIALTINGVDISLGSTAYLQASPGEEMQVNVLTGRALVSSNGITQAVVAGAFTSIGLDDNGLANTAPALPQPYEADRVIDIPTNALDTAIEVARPWQPAPRDNAGIVEALSASASPLNVLMLARREGDREWLDASVNGRLSLPPGTYEVAVGQPPRLETVTIEANQTETITLETGVVEVVDAQGELATVTLLVAEQSGRFVSGATGRVELPPGDYKVGVLLTPSFSVDVTIVAGETTTIPLDATGTVTVLNEDGSVTSQLFTVADAEGTILNSTSSGSMELPRGDYVLRVYTQPEIRELVSVVPGQTVTLTLPPAGTLRIVDTTGEPMQTLMSVRDADGNFVNSATGSMNLLAGSYRVEIFTNPRLFEEFTIQANETTDIVQVRPGHIQLVDSNGEPASLFAIVYDANDAVVTSGSGRLELQPGRYRVEIQSSPRVVVNDVVVQSNETTPVPIVSSGQLQLVTPAGSPASVIGVVRQADGTTYINTTNSQGMAELQPGQYIVELMTIPQHTDEFTIAGGDVVNVVVPDSGRVQLTGYGGSANTLNATLYLPDDSYVITLTNGAVDVLPGQYKVLAFTIPPVTQEVTVRANTTTEVTIAAPGTLQLTSSTTTRLAEFAVLTTDRVTISQSVNGTLTIQPGTYIVRIGEREQRVTVRSNQTVSLRP